MSFLKNRTYLAVSLLLLWQAVAYYSFAKAELTLVVAGWSDFPGETPGWRAIEDTPIDAETLAKLQPDDYLNRTYASTSSASEAVGFFVAYFATQREGRAPHSPTDCLPGAGWKSVSLELKSYDLPSAPAIRVNEYVAEKHGDQLFVVYWYQSGKRVFSDHTLAQLYTIPEMLLHGRTDLAFVRVASPVFNTDLSSARDRAVRFTKDIYPLIRNHLQ